MKTENKPLSAEQELYAMLEESLRWHWGDKWRDSADLVERSIWEDRNHRLKAILEKYSQFKTEHRKG